MKFLCTSGRPTSKRPWRRRSTRSCQSWLASGLLCKRPWTAVPRTGGSGGCIYLLYWYIHGIYHDLYRNIYIYILIIMNHDLNSGYSIWSMNIISILFGRMPSCKSASKLRLMAFLSLTKRWNPLLVRSVRLTSLLRRSRFSDASHWPGLIWINSKNKSSWSFVPVSWVPNHEGCLRSRMFSSGLVWLGCGHH